MVAVSCGEGLFSFSLHTLYFSLACLICGYAGGLQSNLINTVDSTAGFIEIDMITQNLQIIKKYEYI